MDEALKTLSGREKEVLRLLVAGHDAKSVARSLGLSVHTVNERLRDARRKLGVSSSREAARLLARIEQPSSQIMRGQENRGLPMPPDSFADKKRGGNQLILLQHTGQADRRAMGLSIAWLAGGMLVMTLVIAALVLTPAMSGSGQAQGPAPAPPPQEAMDLMPIADTNGDGKVTSEEYTAFSEQGWDFVAQGKDEVNFVKLDPMGKLAFLGIAPKEKGIITRQMYIDAIPNRFKMFDQNGDGALSSDELNGRSFQQQPQ